MSTSEERNDFKTKQAALFNRIVKDMKSARKPQDLADKIDS